jgi:hypothetical protein
MQQTSPTDPPSQEGDYSLSYKILADYGLGAPPVEIQVGKSMGNDNLVAAVHWLRVARLQICDSSMEPANVIEEWDFPYRNRYGALSDDPNDEWGYKFRDPVDGVIKSVWLERCGPRVDFLNESTFKGLMFASEISQKAPEEQLRRSV